MKQHEWKKEPRIASRLKRSFVCVNCWQHYSALTF